MANTNKKAILRALIDGAIVEVLVKSSIENVVYSTAEDGSEVLLSTKLSEIIADLATKDTIADREAAISALRTELMGEGVPEAYDTFKELADYIAEHQEVADALTEAIGNKADKTTVEGIQSAVTAIQEAMAALGALAHKSTVSESDLDAALAEKINASTAANHTHTNKAELDKFVDGDKEKLDNASAAVTTLIGEDTGKSARTIANEELAKQLVPAGAKEALDTLEEIAAWIQSHPDDASAMNQAIVALQNKVDTGDKTVSTAISEAIAALNIGDYAKAADLTALAARVTTLETTVATKGRILYSATQPEDLTENDLWVQLV